ncbi:MAG: hypothetical protein ACEQR4_06810 [Rhodoluna sp.]
MSIRHIVMWKLASEAPEEKLAQAEEMRVALEGLNGVAPTNKALGRTVSERRVGTTPLSPSRATRMVFLVNV